MLLLKTQYMKQACIDLFLLDTCYKSFILDKTRVHHKRACLYMHWTAQLLLCNYLELA